MVNLIVSIHIVLTEFSVDLRITKDVPQISAVTNSARRPSTPYFFLSWYHSLVMCGAAARA